MNKVKEGEKVIQHNQKNEARKKNILDRLTELEKITNEKDEKINFLINKNEKLDVLLEKLIVTDTYVLEVKNLKCETCDFVDKSVAGLKVHAQAKHTKQSPTKIGSF